MVCKERAEALVKTIPLSFLTIFYNAPFIIRVSLTRLRREPSVWIRKKYPLEPRVATVLFVVTIVFDEVRPKVLCIHTKLIIVCRRLQVVKKTARSLCLSCLMLEQKQ